MALATHAANLGIWVRDLVRNEVWATDKWRELLGFAKSERIDLNSFYESCTPKIAKQSARPLRRRSVT